MEETPSSDCLQRYVQAVHDSVVSEEHRTAAGHLFSFLRKHPPDSAGYFYTPDYRRESLVAPYSTEPLKSALLAHLNVLRGCGELFLVACVRDLCGDDVPDVIRTVRVRAWVDDQVRSLRDELARCPEANIAIDLPHLLSYEQVLQPDVVDALRRAHHSAEASDRSGVMAGLHAALAALNADGAPEVSLRGVE